MGRPRKHPSKLPPCVYESHGAYYHVVKGVWHPLGRNLPAALEDYGRRIAPSPEGGLNALLDATYQAVKNAPRPKPWSENTIEQYDLALKKLKHLLRKFSEPQQIKQKDAAQVKVLLAPTPNWANRCVSLARTLFNHLVEHQVIDSNPFLGVKRWKERKRTRLLQWDEWNKIRAAGARRLQLIMDGLYLTDRRINELLDLDERDALTDGIYFDTSKTDKEVIIRWNDDLREWWAACMALHGKVVKVDFVVKDKPRPLFRSRHGKRPSYETVRDTWQRACEKAGVEDANLHDNRAFSATELARQVGGGEAGERAAQKALGHKDRKTTRIYLRDREVEIVDGPTFRRKA